MLPQRPVMTPTEELIQSGVGAAVGGHQTPPLPLPIRKPKPSTTSTTLPTTKAQQQSAPIQAKLNQISLLQLSDMSLGELAATLQLPPARLACMTLTELALRLAELNKCSAEEEEEVAVVEEEEETVQVKLDEGTEVCYKGGRKYEILSNTQEVEDSVAHRQTNDTQRADIQPTSTFNSASEASERDRYAALREIMEQDLAVVSTQVMILQ